VNQYHTRNYIWQNSDSSEVFKVLKDNGSRLIICHAGSGSFGFVKDSKLVFRCTSGSSADYHSQMNSDIFKKWFIQMLNNLEEPCVLVMDNASYHSVHKDYPRSNAKKMQLQEWLKEKKIEFSYLKTVSESRKLVPRKTK